MKKTFLLIVTMLMMGSAAFAGGDVDFCIGPKVGYQAAKLSCQKADIKAGFSNRFTAGLFTRVTIGRFYIEPEVLYFKTSNLFDVSWNGNNSGNVYNIPSNATDVSLTLNQMNLQVPVLFGFEIFDFNIVALRAQVGPTANFTLKSKTLVDYNANGQAAQQHEAGANQGFNPKSISWGLQAGLGVDVLKRITLDINYNFGLSKVLAPLNDTVLGETFDFTNTGVENTKQGMFLVTVGLKLF